MKWSRDRDVRGVVQIAHGLGEHIGRYADLAETLVRGEFAVYGIAHNFYPVGRHETLHELNRREVFTDLLVWISGILERASAR